MEENPYQAPESFEQATLSESVDLVKCHEPSKSFKMSRAEKLAFWLLPVATVTASVITDGGYLLWAGGSFTFLYFPMHVAIAWIMGLFFVVRHPEQGRMNFLRILIWWVGSPVLVLFAGGPVISSLPLDPKGGDGP